MCLFCYILAVDDKAPVPGTVGEGHSSRDQGWSERGCHCRGVYGDECRSLSVYFTALSGANI